MYHPIWQESFKDLFSLKDGKFEIKQDTATRKELMRHLNDNLLQNIHSFSVKNYDETEKLHKHQLNFSKKEALIDQTITECKGDIQKENNEMNKAIDKILIAHRNTKIFLFIMGW